MFETILYPTDFSEVSMKGLNYIKEMKKSGAKKVIVMHAVDLRVAEALHGFLEHSKLEELQWRMSKDAGPSLTTIEKELKEAGLEVETRIRLGVPLREILSCEKEEGVSVLIMGSHGLSNLQEIFLGSVSEKVIRKCKKPMLVIKRR